MPVLAGIDVRHEGLLHRADLCAVTVLALGDVDRECFLQGAYAGAAVI
jgi:hypothetical protein